MDHNAIEAAVKSKFAELITSLGRDVGKWTESMVTRYSEGQRKYHTINHINSMLRCLDSSKSYIEDPIVVELFIFFHDWVYDPMRHDNEVQSVVVFEEFAKELDLPEGLKRKVSSYIEATITHSINSEDIDLKFCLDFDLEVLGREPAEYDVYAFQIREEYGRYGEKEYSLGRIGVLEKFLSRERLFFTEQFYRRLEGQARKNLEGEIEKLRSNRIC